MKYTITISRTADGQQDYMQVLSADGWQVNIVLIGEIEIEDTREVTG